MKIATLTTENNLTELVKYLNDTTTTQFPKYELRDNIVYEVDERRTSTEFHLSEKIRPSMVGMKRVSFFSLACGCNPTAFKETTTVKDIDRFCDDRTALINDTLSKGFVVGEACLHHEPAHSPCDSVYEGIYAIPDAVFISYHEKATALIEAYGYKQ